MVFKGPRHTIQLVKSITVQDYGHVTRVNTLYQNVELRPVVQNESDVALSSLLLNTVRSLHITNINSAYWYDVLNDVTWLFIRQV